MKVGSFKTKTYYIDYIKLLQQCMNLVSNANRMNLNLQGSLKRVYYAFYAFGNRPRIFDDIEQLKQVDQLHKKFYKLNPDFFKHEKRNFPYPKDHKYKKKLIRFMILFVLFICLFISQSKIRWNIEKFRKTSNTNY